MRLGGIPFCSGTVSRLGEARRSGDYGERARRALVGTNLWIIGPFHIYVHSAVAGV